MRRVQEPEASRGREPWDGPGRAPLASGPAPGELDLRQALASVLEARWGVALCLAGALALGVLYLLLAPPVYRSNVLVQVEVERATLGGLEELSTFFSRSSPAEAELEILRSRTLLGEVVDALGLDVVARPQHLPLVGAAIARARGGRGVAGPPPGLGRFAWGGERLVVRRLELPPEGLGRRHVLEAGPQGAWRLLGPGGEELLRGQVGVPAEAAPGAGGVAAWVTELRARPGTRFTVVRERRDEAIERLQEAFTVVERGTGTGVLRLTLEGDDPARVARTLDAIASGYVRQNVERRSAEAQQTLEFLDAQLPVQRAGLEKAEAALEAHRARSGSVDLTLEAKSVLDLTVELEKQRSAVELERAELRQRFTSSHPQVAALERKSAQLQAALAEAGGRLKKLPESELTTARLTRDVKVANEVYTLMLNKAQELRIVRSGTLGNIRILDRALVPWRPARPRPGLVLALALLLGAAAGVAYALGPRAGVRDPELLEELMGVPVFASVPHSDEEPRGRHGAQAALAVRAPGALAVESLRSLRTSLQFALAEAPNHVLCVGGPSPGVGKSFVVVNLAHLLAQDGRRVLLVDADLRKGRLHRSLGGARSPGLSEVLDGRQPLEAALRKGGEGRPDFLPCGAPPPDPAERLGSGRFDQLLARVSAAYDLVVLDVPPLLAVTDGAIVARRAGVNLLVLRFGRHPLREVRLALRRLVHDGVRVSGLVLNDVPVSSRRGSDRHGYFYQYDYR